MRKTSVILLAAASWCFAADTAIVTVVVSGETHAMLYPCDCPDDPGGGFAERATVLKKLGVPENRLLLDAGGFSGGGLYDAYTGGRPLDSQRTVSAVRAMAAMRYDAAAIGDDDLQFGGAWLMRTADSARLPLVSANIFLKNKRPFAPRYRIVTKQGIRFGITALTTEERLFPIDDSCMVAAPIPGLRKIWKDIVASSDMQVIVSHLGEESLKTLADSFPDADIIVNGHRKTSQYRARMFGKILAMQFGYEGKKISFATLKIPKGGRTFEVEKSDWISVAPPAAPDSAVAAVMRESLEAEARPVYDLYIMSQCDYGCAALGEQVSFAAAFPSVESNVWFVGSVQGDSLFSLHGMAEARDEMAWLAVRALRPDKWRAFLAARSRPGAATAAAAAHLGIDTAAVSKWVREKGTAALADHYRRSMRLNVTASPTLFINNTRYEKNIEVRRLAKMECARMKKRPSLCDSLPACFDDGDCRQKGMVGRCAGAGACEFTPDAAFLFTALVADSTLQHPEKNVIAATYDLFPNATIESVRLSSARGQAMMKTYAPTALPFYLFGARVAQAHNFSRVESGLAKVRDGYSFKNDVVSRNYFPQRRKMAGSVRLFLDPLFPESEQAYLQLASDSSMAARVQTVPVFFSDPAGAASGTEEKTRREEAVRWLVLDSLYRDAYSAYLSGYFKNPGSSYWFENLRKCGIDLDAFVAAVGKNGRIADAHWRQLAGLGIKDPVALLLDNRQLVVVRNEAGLADVLTALRQGAAR